MTDLTTLAKVKEYLGIAENADDAVLSSMITAYSEWVRSFTNRDFSLTTYDIWRSGRGGQMMVLPQFPIVSVQGISIDGTDIPAASSVRGYGYRFSDNLLTLSGAYFTIGINNVRIQFQAGFATIPADIAQAVNELVGLRYNLRDKMEWTSKSLAGETVSLNTRDMPASVATVLKQYASLTPL